MKRNHFGDWTPVVKPCLDGKYVYFADMEKLILHNKEMEYELRQECFQHQLTKQKLEQANHQLTELSIENRQLRESIRMHEGNKQT